MAILSSDVNVNVTFLKICHVSASPDFRLFYCVLTSVHSIFICDALFHRGGLWGTGGCIHTSCANESEERANAGELGAYGAWHGRTARAVPVRPWSRTIIALIKL